MSIITLPTGRYSITIFKPVSRNIFIEYLKKYHTKRWEQLSFERLFGISQQDFFFYQFHPLKFIPYLFNKDDADDSNVAVYKKRIQLSLLGIMTMFVMLFVGSYIGV